MKPQKQIKLYTIHWILNGVVREELNFNNPRPIAETNWWIRHLRATSYTTGVLVANEV